ncbi:MAG: bifunctional UDP-N-acetylglucosamine diphosphorylase/glucosamine-1-phosphate N-acetyltransferase GlmU [Bacillus subtilis]|nr:bifunctional UDP-N-acetylglucosamine diphosphorylase/glucosamine-1-phosphate N-acetyltransferase GlmU [Bacillus subtilis]
MKRYAIILAAGKGTRMKTELPKMRISIAQKPMIAYIIENVHNSHQTDETIVVVGHKREVIQEILGDRVAYALQLEQLGTGHAVMVTKPLISDMDGCTIILPGDMPLVDTKTIERAFHEHHERRNDLTVVTTRVEDPTGYGRIIRDESGYLEGIIEHHEATILQKGIDEINTGVYIVNNKILFDALDRVDNNNSKKEYYLTDIVNIIKTDGNVIGTYFVKESYKTMGVNDLYSLSIAEAKLRQVINQQLMISGVAMINPDTITIGQNVVIEENVVIHPNTYITGNSIIKRGAQIGPNTEIHESIIGERVICRHSLVFNSIVHEDTTIGPFAHLREGANIGPHNRIGNFVEIKKSTTGANTKASHLAYIGDGTVGKNVNFGCGAVTVNYDGVNKYQTVIGDDVFVGCNANLIAPIVIGDNSFIAAGSTLNKNVPNDALAIARAYQVNKENYVRVLNGKKKENK